MKKTSLYLEMEQAERLRWLAEREGRSQAAILREAIELYEAQVSRRRDFACAGSAEGPGDSMADIAEDQYLVGFGGESYSASAEGSDERPAKATGA
jgi:predicted transcriptional regulator